MEFKATTVLGVVRDGRGAIGSEQFDTFATLNGSVQEAIARRARQLGHERAAAQAEALAQRSSAPGSA